MTTPAIDFLNVPEDMLDQPVEAWVPKVGDRVRVTGGIAECLTASMHNGYDELVGHPHAAREVGRTGRVYAVWDPAKNRVNKSHLLAVWSTFRATAGRSVVITPPPNWSRCHDRPHPLRRIHLRRAVRGAGASWNHAQGGAGRPVACLQGLRDDSAALRGLRERARILPAPLGDTRRLGHGVRRLLAGYIGWRIGRGQTAHTALGLWLRLGWRA